MRHNKKNCKKTLTGQMISAALIILCFSFLAVWINRLSTTAAVPVAATEQKVLLQEEESALEMEVTRLVEDKVLEVPYLSQKGILPTGCEVTSAAMVLQYWGVDIAPEELADKLPCDYLFWEDGKLYGPDPNRFFVGSPFDPNSYGCFAPVIASIVPKADTAMTAQVLTNVPLEDLYNEYVSQGVPVLVWCTIQMLETSDGTRWTLPSGEEFVWPRNEHCMVLSGREENEYICMDPYGSIGQRAIDRELLEKRYEELGQQAVVILPEEKVIK